MVTVDRTPYPLSATHTPAMEVSPGQHAAPHPAPLPAPQPPTLLPSPPPSHPSVPTGPQEAGVLGGQLC